MLRRCISFQPEGFQTAARKEDATREWGLEAFAQVFEDDIAGDGGDEGDGEVGKGEDVVEGVGEGLGVGVGAGELAHEEVRVEEEDDEGDLDDRFGDASEQRSGFGVVGHEERRVGFGRPTAGGGCCWE